MEMKNIAIIPARGGSKRIPLKNIMDFAGKPVITYSISNAISSGLFNEVIVSTDNEEIAGIAKSSGANIPFLRSDKNADDFATTSNVLLEVLERYEEAGEKFDYGCCIYPATPLISGDVLVKGYRMMLDKSFDCVFPVVPFSYPIWRGMTIVDGKARMIWPENIDKRSQDLETVYHDAGQFYWFNVKSFKANRRLISDNAGTIILSENEVQDIDTISDWELAELKYSLLNDRK